MSLERMAARAISGYRRRNGLEGVTTDPKLTAAARDKARRMARGGSKDHDSDPLRNIIRAGYEPLCAGECLAGPRPGQSGPSSFAVAFELWQESPGHNYNLLLKGATQIGIAECDRCWALILAAPMPKQHKHVRTNTNGWFSWLGL